MRFRAGLLAILLGIMSVLVFGSPVAALTSTTTSLSSTVNPSAYGAAVTFRATVSPTPPTGTVSFFDGATLLGSGAVGPRGVAEFTTALLAVGNHSMTASFGGTPVFGASTSGPLTQSVTKAPTTVSISANPNPAAPGHQITFTAQVTPGSTGMVEFLDGGTFIASTSILPSGQAILGYTGLNPGPHTITAHYLGDATHNASQGSVNVSVLIPTSTALSVSPNPTAWGQPLILGASVTPEATGVVQFRRDDGTPLGQCTLASSACSTTSAALPAGTHSVTALYTGDPTHGVSVSVATDAVVHKVESMTVVAPVTGVWGEPVRLTADVSPRATGTVTFTEGATVLGTSVVMGDGRSTLDVSGLTVGSHTITATYSGDTNVKASVGSAAVTVSPVPTAVVLLASPATVGQPLSITARVTPTSAQGSMTLTDNGELLGACTLAQGTCAIVTRTLAVGPHTINASYSGDPLHATSAASLTVHVDPLTVRARAKAVARKSKVRVSVSPRCTAQYSFSVERKTGKKWVKRGKTYRTAGSRNRRDVDLPRGTYRVAVAGGCGRLGTTTSTVTLMR